MSHPFRTIRSFPRLPRLHYLPLLPLLGLTILAASSQGCDSDNDSKDSKAADKGPGAALKCASSGKNAAAGRQVRQRCASRCQIATRAKIHGARSRTNIGLRSDDALSVPLFEGE